MNVNSVFISAEVTPGESDIKYVSINPDGIVIENYAVGYGEINTQTIMDLNEVSATVQSNSASWGGGGATLPITGTDGYFSASLDTTGLEINGGNDYEASYGYKISISSNGVDGIEIGHGYIDINDGSIETINAQSIRDLESVSGTVNANSASWGGGATLPYYLEPNDILLSGEIIPGESEYRRVNITSAGIGFFDTNVGDNEITTQKIMDWDEVSSTVNTNSSTWNDVSSKQDTLTFGYDVQDKISAINNSAIAGGSFDIVPISGTGAVDVYEQNNVLWISGKDFTSDISYISGTIGDVETLLASL